MVIATGCFFISSECGLWLLEKKCERIVVGIARGRCLRRVPLVGLERLCDQCEGFGIGDADAERLPGREWALEGNGAVGFVAGDGGSGAVALLFGDDGTFVANPFAVVLEGYLLERFGENRGTLVLDIVGDCKGCGG